MNARKSILFLLLLPLTFSEVCGQTAILDSLYRSLDSTLQQVRAHRTDQPDAPELTEMDTLFSQGLIYATSTPADVLQAQANRARADWGLSVTASANHYARNTPDPESNDPTRTLARAGVSWDAGNAGWYHQRLKARRLELERDLLNLSEPRTSKERAYAPLYQAIGAGFARQQEPVLLDLIQLLDRKAEMLEALYLLRQISRDEWTAAQQDRELVLRQLATCRAMIAGSTRAFPDLDTNFLPGLGQLPDLALNAVLQQDTSRLSAEMAMERDRLDLEWESDVIPSVRVTAAYNARIGSAGTTTEGYPSIGLSVRIPLKTFSKTNEPYFEQRETEIRQQKEWAELNRQKELTNLAFEYRYKLRQSQAFQHQLQELDEALRKGEHLAEAVLQPAQLWADLSLLEQRLQTEVEAIDLCKGAWLLLLKIHTRSECAHPSQLFERIHPDTTGNQRWMLVTAAALAPAQRQYTLDYLRQGDWTQVALAPDVSDDVISDLVLVNFRVAQVQELTDFQTISVNNFPNRLALETYLRTVEKLHPERTLVIDHLDALLQLDQQQLLQSLKP